MEKIKTILWFLGKPNLYPQLLYLVRQSIFPHPKEKTSALALRWCEAEEINTSKALAQITGTAKFRKVEKIHEKDFEDAHSVVSLTPLRMGGGGNCDLLYNLVRSIRPSYVIETGVAYGWSSMAILLGIEDNNHGCLISTDMPYAKMNNEHYVGCIIPERLMKHWQLIRKPDRQSIPKALAECSTLQLAHYDSDKSYRGRMWAYPRLWKKLDKGGMLISDDIEDNLAFKDFSERLKVDPIVVSFEKKYIGILIKDG